MVVTDKDCRTSTKAPGRKRHALQPQSMPSPALCCACGLCLMLAGINITLVGAFAFGTFIPTGNPLIIVGPLLLLIALAFFTACCVFSRRPPAHMARGKAKDREGWGLMRLGAAVFEMETSEHTLQDTTAMQISATDSPSSSHRSSSSHGDTAAVPRACEDGAAAATVSELYITEPLCGGDNIYIVVDDAPGAPDDFGEQVYSDIAIS